MTYYGRIPQNIWTIGVQQLQGAEQVTSGGAPRTRGLHTTQEIIETNFIRIIFVCNKSLLS